MNEGVIPVVFFITFFGTIFGVMYFYYTTRNRERLAIIEKNADPSILKIESTNLFKTFSLKLGMLMMGGGFGTLMGSILETATRIDEDVAYGSMVFLFAGAGLVASHFVARRIKD